MVERDPRAIEIGGRIAEARRETGGMSQEELAAFLKVSPRSVQAYELGEVIPYRYMRELERVLGKPVAWFLHGEAAIETRDEQLAKILEVLHRQGEALDLIVAHLGLRS